MWAPPRSRRQLGQTEIEDLDASVGHDENVFRLVAIKVLPASFADSERLRRCDQDARSIAALNHPNILAIFDIGVHDGVAYIVSELLEGEPLRAKLMSGALPLRRAVEYGIARGLSAAHERGVIHRDLIAAQALVVGAIHLAHAARGESGLDLVRAKPNSSGEPH